MPFIVLDPAAAQAAPVTTIGAPRTGVPGKTLAVMRAELKRMLGNRTDLADPGDYDTWLNDAYIDLATSLDADEMKGSLAVSTVVNQALYLLPDVVSSIQLIALVDSTLPDGGYPLSKTDKATYRSLPTESGAPQFYFRERNMLVLWPTPDKVWSLSLDFRIKPARLTADTHIPVFGEEWHRAVVLDARQKAFDDLMEFDKSLVAEGSVATAVRRRKSREGAEDENRVVKSSAPTRGRPRYRGYPDVRDL